VNITLFNLITIIVSTTHFLTTTDYPNNLCTCYEMVLPVPVTDAAADI